MAENSAGAPGHAEQPQPRHDSRHEHDHGAGRRKPAFSKKERLLLGIIAAIAIVWVAVGIWKWGYVYWPALAGAFSIPFLLAALFVDNIPMAE